MRKVNISMDTDMLDEIDKLAQIKRLSRSEIIRSYVRRGMKNETNKN